MGPWNTQRSRFRRKVGPTALVALLLQIVASLHGHAALGSASGAAGEPASAALEWTAHEGGATGPASRRAEPLCAVCLGLSQLRHIATPGLSLEIPSGDPRASETGTRLAVGPAAIDLWAGSPRSPPRSP